MNFGIVGTGMIAGFHAKALSGIPEARFVACLDVDLGRAAAFAAANGCAPYSDLDRFLAHPGLDAVTICTPSGAHMEPAIAAARAGKHVIVEKPLEITSERCQAIIDECDRAGVILSGIFPSRFHESSAAIRKAVDSGRFGKVTMGNAYVKWWRDQKYYDDSAWKGTLAFDGGGALMNQSIHAVDLLLWFMGPVAEVMAYSGKLGHERIEVEDSAAAVLRFASGAIGVIQGSTAVWPGFLKRIEVSGVSGSAIMEEEDIVFWKFRDETAFDDELRARLSTRTLTGGGAADPAAIGYHGHRLQFEDFIDAARCGRKPAVDGREAKKAVDVICAVYASAASGGPVCI